MYEIELVFQNHGLELLATTEERHVEELLRGSWRENLIAGQHASVDGEYIAIWRMTSKSERGIRLLPYQATTRFCVSDAISVLCMVVPRSASVKFVKNWSKREAQRYASWICYIHLHLYRFLMM
jgi:hypothetical protein